ncbi:hypothetical protein BJF78_20810 [Pseudonocardia sp. CNS-139]|nr:hypothetical protein BJF78_20810 [Pseudonocardia sp. CNS-139]
MQRVHHAAAERDAGDYAAAVGRYRLFRGVYPGTELVPFVTTELYGTFADWGRAGRDSGDYSGAIRVYEDALTEPDAPGSVRVELAATYLERAADTRAEATGLPGYQAAVTDALTVADEFGDTPSAALVPVSLADTYAAAAAPVAQQRFCDAIPALDYFVGLTHPAAAAVVGTANADRARSLLECGLGRYRGGDGAGSLQALEPFVAAYPNDPGILQARSAVVAATIAGAKGAPLPPLPGPLAGDNVGPVAYTIYNDSPYEVRVLLNGPTTHEVVIPPCPDCGTGYAVPPPDCPSRPGLPSVTLRLLVGVYDDLAFSPSQPDVDEVVDTNTFEPGFDYSACYYPIVGN